MDIVRRMQLEASEAFASRSIMQLLALLLLLDAMFIAAHILHVGNGFEFFRRPRFSMERERGYSEWYEYLKTAVCILAFIGCYRASAQPVYRGLAIIYGLILADNAVQLHERTGLWLSQWLHATKWLFDHAPYALGEFAFLATLGALGLTILFVTLLRSGAEHQARGALFVILMLILGGFGVGLDLLHAAIKSLEMIDLDHIVGIVEESGELIILSVSCALATALFSRMVLKRLPAGGR